MAHVPEAELVIAGNDEENYQPFLLALAKKAGVAARYRSLGPVDSTEKWDLLQKARMLVLPSYSENFGNVILEAMAVGCPVVVTPEVGLGVRPSARQMPGLSLRARRRSSPKPSTDFSKMPIGLGGWVRQGGE